MECAYCEKYPPMWHTIVTEPPKPAPKRIRKGGEKLPTKKYRNAKPKHGRVALRESTDTPCPRCRKMLISIADEYGDYLSCWYCGHVGYFEPISAEMDKSNTGIRKLIAR